MNRIAVAFCATLVLAGGSADAAPVAPPFPRIANCYGVGLRPNSTPADIEEIARFDLLIGGVSCNWEDAGQRAQLADNIAAVRRKNPHILILDFSSSAPYHYPGDATFPKDGWLLQPDGRHVLGWPGTEMINLTRPAVLDFLAARSLASIKERGLDGSFIDCMGGGFDWWACNIEHGEAYHIDADGDGKPDERKALDAAWLKAKTDLSRKVRQAIGPDAVFMGNQAGDWGAPSLNGILLEDYLDYVLDNGASWDRAIQEYLRWCSQARRPNVTTIVSSSGIEPPFNPWKTVSAEERNALLERGRNLKQRMRFGLTTTLMGDGYFAYDQHTRWRGQRWWYPEYDAPLGFPRGPGAAQPDGTWRREFDGVTVVVNPTRFDAVVRFRTRRRDASSGKVDRQFLIPARDGRILLPTDEPAAAGSLPDPSPAFTREGPEAFVERDGWILCRLPGAAALFDAQGRLSTLLRGNEVLLENVQTVVAGDDRWRNFAYEECRHERLPRGGLRFTGRRVEGGSALAYTVEVQVSPKEIALTYRWEAASDTHVHAFRQQADFPVARYAGGRCRTAGGDTPLPAQRSAQPLLATVPGEVTAHAPAGPPVTVTLSGAAALVDERHYSVDAYRLGYMPLRGDVKRGQRWEYTVRLALGR